MIRKNKIEQVDKYLSGELTGDALSEFNAGLAFDQDLKEELELQEEIREAIMEADVMELRSKLEQIGHENTGNSPVMQEKEFSFELSEDLASFKEFNQPVNASDINGFAQGLPKIHLAQHNIAEKENIHYFYKEQQQAQEAASDEISDMTPMDEAIFEGVRAAVEENDIQDLRANLQQIAASIPAHQRTSQEIDQYVSGELDGEMLEGFEQELGLSKGLAKDVGLFGDIDLAIAENDIMELRASLQAVQQTEASRSQKIEEIDQYINEELTGEGLTAFEAELQDNADLAAELELFRDIDSALQETEVMGLRAKLEGISREAHRGESQKRSFAARVNSSRVAIATIAASLVLILGLAGIVSRKNAATDTQLYVQFFQPYQATGVFRSGDALVDSKLTQALREFNQQDYQSAIGLFAEVLKIDNYNPVGNFYTGMAYQETGKFQMALKAFNNVVQDRDNLFTEQAQWYTGLCYLQTENREKAYKQFKKIAQSGGFYQQKAEAILKKIKYLE